MRGLARVLDAPGHRDIGLQAGLAEQLDHPSGAPLPSLWPGVWKAVKPRVAIPENGVEVRRLALVVRHTVLLAAAMVARQLLPLPGRLAGRSIPTRSRPRAGALARRAWRLPRGALVIDCSGFCR